MKTVKITEQEYIRLLKDSEKLAALEVFGVDNWSGYYSAMESIADSPIEFDDRKPFNQSDR